MTITVQQRGVRADLEMGSMADARRHMADMALTEGATYVTVDGLTVTEYWERPEQAQMEQGREAHASITVSE